MRFRFKLQPLMRKIMVEEQRKKIELARTLTNIRVGRARIHDLKLEIRVLLERRPLCLEWAPFSGEKIVMNSEALKSAEQNLNDLLNLSTHKRQELVDIILRRKTLEQRKNAEHKDHRLRESRREQKAFDGNHRLLGRKGAP